MKLFLLFLQRPNQLLSAAHLSSLPVFRAAPQTSQLGQPLSTQRPEPAEQVRFLCTENNQGTYACSSYLQMLHWCYTSGKIVFFRLDASVIVS